MKNLKFLFIGMFFGFVLVKSEVISWFRIQEMFRFHAINMYGIIGIAVLMGVITVLLIKKFDLKSINGETIKLDSKPFKMSNLYGGIIFGFGWALTGACPGPLYALLGSGYLIIGVAILAALFGAFTYGALQKKLPH